MKNIFPVILFTILCLSIANAAEFNASHLSRVPSPELTSEITTPADSASTHPEEATEPAALLDCSVSYPFLLTDDGNADVSATLSGLGYCCEGMYIYDGVAPGPFMSGPLSMLVYGVEAGMYTAVVNCIGSPEFGCPTVSFVVTPDVVSAPNDIEMNDTPGTAVVLGENATTEGHIGYRRAGETWDAHDLYEVTVTDFEGLHINANFTTTELNKAIIFYAQDGVTMLGSGYDLDENGIIDLDVPGLGPGTYYIDVYTYYFCSTGYILYECAVSTYTLTTAVTDDGFLNDPEPNGTIATATPMPENSTAEGNVGHYLYPGAMTNDYNDLYELVTTEDGDIQVDINTSLPFGYMYLYDNDAWWVLGTVSITAPGAYSLTVTGLAAGTYYIEVQGYYPSPGGYAITNTVTHAAVANDIEPNDDFASATVMPAFGSATGHIAYRYNGGTFNTTDYYKINLPVTGDLDVSLNTTAGYNTMTLYNSAGGWVGGTAGFAGLLTINALALPPDDYYIELFTYVSYAGWYTLSTNFSCPDATITASGALAFCEGGSVELSVAPGYDSYTWSNGEITNSITVTESGTYHCDVTWNGCTVTSSDVTVDVFPNPEPVIVADGPTDICLGASVNLSVTAPFISYLWSDGETTSDVDIMGWGDYSVVVTDANGCQGTSNVIHVMTFDTDPTIYMDGPIDFCEGDSVQLGMTAGYDSYLWNTGETTNSLMVHESGIYQCTATFGGCTVSTIELPVDVFPNPEPVIVADGPLEFCLGESVNLSVTEPFDSYLWSDGETTSAVNIMGWGDYSVVVTDVNGCQGTSNIISVMTWGVPVVSISASGTTICYEGSVTLTATSTDPVQWKRDGADIPGATDLNYIADIPGHYTCMATNGACSAESGVIKLKYADRINTTPAGTVALCGPFVVLSVPAAPATTYQWYEKTVPIAGATSNAYSATAPGKYHCFVTKAGCTRVSKLITVTPCRSADEYIQMDVYPNPASNSFTVTYSVTDPGKIILSVLDITGKEMISLGTERQSGTWDEQFSTDDLASGLYIVTLQDAAGNIRQQKIVIEK